tara:strand:- start:8640 stop:8900 length:261 start_codon:yes stop_codon:yes gene_type:complete
VEEIMIIEGLGSVSFVNGLLRIQTLAVGPDGKINETGSIEIPGNKVGDLITSLTAAAQGISEKIGDDSEASTKNEEKKSSNKKKKK